MTVLFIGFACAHCTVQKRIHRRGWDVRWNTKFRSDQNISDRTTHEDKKEICNSLSDISNQTSEKTTSFVQEISSNKMTDSDILPSRKSVEINQSKSYEDTTSESEIEEENHSMKSPRSRDEDESMKDNGVMAGVILIITSLATTTLMLMLLLGFVNTEASLMLSIAIVCLGVASAVVFGIGLFLIVRNIVERKHPEKKKKRFDRMMEKRKDPNYNPDRFNIILGIIVVTIGVGLIALIRSLQ